MAKIRKVRKISIPQEIRFTVFGNPKPKQMARTVRNKSTGNVHSFKPKASADWEMSIAGQALQYKPDVPLDGPLELGCLIFRSVPKSFSKTKKELALSHQIRPITKPDIKNLIANVEDALNGLFWIDDARVVSYVDIDGLATGKYYSETPRIEILIRQVCNGYT